MEIDKMLTLSTAHIDQESANYLDEESDLVVYSKHEFGWFVYTGESTYLLTVPEPLKRVIRFAQSKGCAWLCLDRDGQTIDELTIYNW